MLENLKQTLRSWHKKKSTLAHTAHRLKHDNTHYILNSAPIHILIPRKNTCNACLSELCIQIGTQWSSLSIPHDAKVKRTQLWFFSLKWRKKIFFCLVSIDFKLFNQTTHQNTFHITNKARIFIHIPIFQYSTKFADFRCFRLPYYDSISFIWST